MTRARILLPVYVRYDEDVSIESHVMFGRRRRQARAQYRLPDWVWGLALGLIVVLIGGGFLLFTSLSDGGGGTCDQRLQPLPGTVEATAEGFREEDRLLTEVVTSLEQGDLVGAEDAFYGEAHAFTHNIDPNIREIDEEQAKAVCEAVLDIEATLEGGSVQAMLTAARTLREELRASAEVLGFPRPG